VAAAGPGQDLVVRRRGIAAGGSRAGHEAYQNQPAAPLLK